MRIILIIMILFCTAQGQFGITAAYSANKKDSAMNDNWTTYDHAPASGEKPKSMVIMLHGLGSNGQDLISLAPYMAARLPDTVFVSPDAPFPCDMAPIGHQWFSLQDRTPSVMLSGVQRAAPMLDSYITTMMEKYDVSADKVALLGFSQGTMMSLFVGPRFPEKLAGILGYSGALIGSNSLSGSDINKIPVHLIHGDADDVVPVDRFYDAESALREAGFVVSGSVTKGLPHSIDEKGIVDGMAFLHSILY